MKYLSLILLVLLLSCKHPEPEKPQIYIISLNKYENRFDDSDNWILQFCIDGVPHYANFNSSRSGEVFIEYLKTVGVLYGQAE